MRDPGVPELPRAASTRDASTTVATRFISPVLHHSNHRTPKPSSLAAVFVRTWFQSQSTDVRHLTRPPLTIERCTGPGNATCWRRRSRSGAARMVGWPYLNSAWKSIKERLRGLCFLSALHRCRSGALRHVERVDGRVQPGAGMTRTGGRWRWPDRSFDRHAAGSQYLPLCGDRGGQGAQASADRSRYRDIGPLAGAGGVRTQRWHGLSQRG